MSVIAKTQISARTDTIFGSEDQIHFGGLFVEEFREDYNRPDGAIRITNYDPDDPDVGDLGKPRFSIMLSKQQAAELAEFLSAE